MKKNYEIPVMKMVEIEAKTVILQGSNFLPNGEDGDAGVKRQFGFLNDDSIW